MVTSINQRRALRLLVDSPRGCTVANMLAHGFTNAMLDRMVCDGLATIQPGTMRTSTRRITVIWVAITEIGRACLLLNDNVLRARSGLGRGNFDSTPNKASSGDDVAVATRQQPVPRDRCRPSSGARLPAH
jgi:hypothetical protein